MITPSPLDVISAVLDARLGELHTCMPAEVVRVHSDAHKLQFVDVQPSLKREAYGVDGELLDEELPVIPMVPVAYTQGGGFFISVPLAIGDIVLLVFAERSIDQWLQTANKAGRRTITPGDVSTHSLQGAIALPCGPAPRPALLEGVSATDLVIGGPSGVLMRMTESGQVRLAEGAGEEGIALGLKTNAELADLKQQVAALKLALEAGLAAVTDVGGRPAIVTALCARQSLWREDPMM